MDNLKKQHSLYMSEFKYEYIFDSITNVNSIKIVTLSLGTDTCISSAKGGACQIIIC